VFELAIPYQSWWSNFLVLHLRKYTGTAVWFRNRRYSFDRTCQCPPLRIRITVYIAVIPFESLNVTLPVFWYRNFGILQKILSAGIWGQLVKIFFAFLNLSWFFMARFVCFGNYFRGTLGLAKIKVLTAFQNSILGNQGCRSNWKFEDAHNVLLR